MHQKPPFSVTNRLLNTYFLFACLVAGCLPFAGWAQSQEQLRAQRSKLQERIRMTREVLTEKEQSASVSLSDLKALNEQIRQGEEILGLLRKEQTYLGKQIGLSNHRIDSLSQLIGQLKEEYGNAIYQFSKTFQGANQLALIFSSESVEQLLARLNYLELYQKTQRKQLLEFEGLKSELAAQRSILEERKTEKDNLLQTNEQERKRLEQLVSEKSQLSGELNSQISDLKRKLSNEQQALKRLSRSVTQAISASEKPKGSPKAEVAPKTEISAAQTKATIALVTFEGMKAALKWPVKEGFISGRFGKQPHPALPGVFVDNLGVDIRTKKNTPIKAIYPGKVTAVTKVPGMNYMVMVQHNNYFTVYAKLSRVKVKAGQAVTDKTTLGFAAPGEEGVYEMQLQIWKQNQQLDPEEWLKQ